MIKTLEIKRSKWGCGGGCGELLNVHGKMCCLGFFAIKCGFKPKEILNKDMPSSLLTGTFPITEMKNLSKKLKNLKPLIKVSDDENNDIKITTYLAGINDSTQVKYKNDPSLREKKIQEKFAEIGVKVKFVD